MNNARFSPPDAARSRLRTIVAKVDREISLLSTEVTNNRKPTNDLPAAWGELVKALVLGPEPEVRECPVCQGIGMREATRCLYCWSTFEPPPLVEARATT